MMIIIIILFTEVQVLILLTAVVSSTPKLTHVIPAEGRGRVSAVTSLDNEVFVLRSPNQQQVEVYDASTFTLQRIKVPGLGTNSRGLAACAHYKCLYVSDHDQCSIHRAELSGSSAVKKWSVDSGPAGLSVTKKHKVVVACWAAHKILEYKTDGGDPEGEISSREISLEQGGMTHPWHAFKLSTGDYVVSEWKSSGGAVSLVGIDGRVVRRYCPSPSSVVGEGMDGPIGLAVT